MVVNALFAPVEINRELAVKALHYQHLQGIQSFFNFSFLVPFDLSPIIV
jgi:hypothetical protein